MVKEVFFFNEMAYSAYPQEEAEKLGYTNLLFPNEYFDSNKAHELYDMYLDEFEYANDVGFDGVMVNEHHYNPLNMMPGINLIAAILARNTKKGRIILLGNILPVREDPIRIAEEIAMLDTLSGGRIVCGFVRGVGQESIATNANPVHNRERYYEAHDLIIKAWTTPGPFRWEGKHYQYRVVNPWILPLQKPHPPIWVPGIMSPETIQWAARMGYPYIAQNTSMEGTPEIWKLYNDTAAEAGRTTSNQNFGYLQRICVADTDEKAYEEGKHLYWQLGRTFGRAPAHWFAPPGYVTRGAARSRLASREATLTDIGYEQAQEINQIITGNPDTVIEKLKNMVDVVDPAWLILWPREGPMSHANAVRGMELLGNEVIPAIKDYVPGSRSPSPEAAKAR